MQVQRQGRNADSMRLELQKEGSSPQLKRFQCRPGRFFSSQAILPFSRGKHRDAEFGHRVLNLLQNSQGNHPRIEKTITTPAATPCTPPGCDLPLPPKPRVSHKTLHPGLSSLQPSGLATPEACKEISPGYAFFAYPEYKVTSENRTPKAVRGACPVPAVAGPRFSEEP